jgi:DegV family protein with EDD domain
MLKIVTDGGADMPAGWEQNYNINILPLWVRFGEKMYTQGLDLGPYNFYDLVRLNRIIPKTSLPSPQQVIDFYRGIAAKGDDILSVHIASKLSGTFSVIQLAARELAGEINVIPFDSGAGSAAMGWMCREARILDRAGVSLAEITQRLECARRQLMVIFTVDNLDFARLSGRVNALQSTISSILNIKPVIMLRDGLLYAGEKVRTRQKALDRILECVKERMGTQKLALAVVHAADLETAQALVQKAKTLFNIKEVIVTDLSIPVAAHLGPGTVGIVAIPVEEDCKSDD